MKDPTFKLRTGEIRKITRKYERKLLRELGLSRRGRPKVVQTETQSQYRVCDSTRSQTTSGKVLPSLPAPVGFGGDKQDKDNVSPPLPVSQHEPSSNPPPASESGSLQLEEMGEPEVQAAYEELCRLTEERRRTRGMDYYIPNPSQFMAHRSEARTICYSGGNRSGKSTFGAMELCFHLTRQYPEWFSKRRRFKGPIKALISAYEFPTITRVIEPKLFSYLPRDYYKEKRTAQGYLSRILCKDGSIVDILVNEMKDEAYQGADWDFIWCDEPQQRTKYYSMKRGLVDRRGQMIFTFTPLTEPWMKEELIDQADDKNISVFEVSIRSNTSDIHGTPILSEEAIADFERTLPEDFRDTMVSGKFFHLKGLVYKEFGEAHLFSDKPVYEYPDPVICVLDPHDRLPHHVIWAWVDRQNDVFVDHEFTGHQELDELAKTILKIEASRGYKVRKRLIDPNFGRKPSRVGSNLSVMQELARHSCGFFEAADSIELGHMVVRDYLHWDRSKPQTAVNKPKLFFSKERAPLTIKSVRSLQYDEWRGPTKDERDKKEIEKERDTHGADCIRYLLIQKPTHSRLTERSDSYELSQHPY